MISQSQADESPLFDALGVSVGGLHRLLMETGWAGEPLIPLEDTGLAHAHVRLGESGQLLRIPKQSQVNLSPEAHLTHEASCFEAASPSQVTPSLHRILPVSEGLPRGALVLDCVDGAPLQLPDHLRSLMASLAAIHRVDVPAPVSRRLALPDDPLTAMVQEVQSQAEYLEAAGVRAPVRHRLLAALKRSAEAANRSERPPATLITFDAHPGNFLIDRQGTAWMVDLEKCRISYPGFDLAHATLYTSTTWDIHSRAVLDVDQIARAYQAWEDAFGAGAAAYRLWHVPLRRLMWLWSTTWCAKWLALSGQSTDHGDGQDWSESNNEQALNAHVRDRATHYLDEAVIAAIVSEFKELDQLLNG